MMALKTILTNKEIVHITLKPVMKYCVCLTERIMSCIVVALLMGLFLAKLNNTSNCHKVVK